MPRVWLKPTDWTQVLYPAEEGNQPLLHPNKLLSGPGTQSPYPCSTSGWSNNSNNTQQISGRKIQFSYLWGIHVSTPIPKTVRQNEVYMSFWTKEKKGDEVWDSKEEICNSQLRGEPREQIFAWILLVYRTLYVLSEYAKVLMLRSFS